MKVYIYGAHVKEGYSKEYKKFEDIAHEGMSKSKTGIWDLVHSKSKQKFEWVKDCLKHVPYVGRRPLISYAEYRRGKSKFRGIQGLVGYELWDRLLLMNDEVTWQWKTGSDLTYRFDSMFEAANFFAWVLEDFADDPRLFVEEYSSMKWNVGDRVELLKDVEFNFSSDLDDESEMLAMTISSHSKSIKLPKTIKLCKGKIVRVFDVNANGFAISPIDNITAFRVPRTGGAKVVYGSKTFLSFDVAKLVKGV